MSNLDLLEKLVMQMQIGRESFALLQQMYADLVYEKHCQGGGQEFVEKWYSQIDNFLDKAENFLT